MNTAAFGQFLYVFVSLYLYLIIARCLLSWFPAINWANQPWQSIRAATDPAMRPFQNLIPPIGGLDLSPLILFFLLQLLQGLIQSSLCGGYCRLSF